jgi:ribosomal protein L31E
MAEFSLDGKKEMANKLTIEGVIGDSFPLTIYKRGYKKVETNLNVNSFHQTKNLVEINLKKKFLGIF